MVTDFDVVSARLKTTLPVRVPGVAASVARSPGDSALGWPAEGPECSEHAGSGKRASRARTMRRFVRLTVPPSHRTCRGDCCDDQCTSPAWPGTRTPGNRTPPTARILQNPAKPTPWCVGIRESPNRSQNACWPRAERKPYATCIKTAPESMFRPWSARPSRTWVISPGQTAGIRPQNRLVSYSRCTAG